MSDKKKAAEKRIVEKVAARYLRLRRNGGDETDVLSAIQEFVEDLFSRLGVGHAQEAIRERVRRISEAAAKKVRHELKQKEYLLDVKIKVGEDTYVLPFLPDVLIPNTPQNEEKWRFFLETLAPKTRIGEDEKTNSVGIPYRDGVWLGDLVFAEDVTSFYIVEDISRIMGRVTARNVTVLNKRFGHEITIEKDLEIHCGLLRWEPPPVTLGGGMVLFGPESIEGLQCTPERLVRWGLRHGKTLRLRKNIYTFSIQEKKGLTEYALRGVNVQGSYEWVSGKWLFTQEIKIPAELLARIHSKLNKMCLHLGLGPGFVAGTAAKLETDIDRIKTYLEFSLQGHGKAGEAWGDAFEERDLRGLIENLSALEAVLVSGAVDQAEVIRRLDGITDSDLDKVAAYTSRPREKIDLNKIRQDLDLLNRLLGEDLDVKGLFGDGVNAASFLYSTFRSDASRDRLVFVLKDLASDLADLAGAADTGESVDLGGLLADPQGTMHTLREALPEGYEHALNRLEADLSDLERTSPKELARKIIHISSPGNARDLGGDMELLQKIFTLQKTDINGLGLDPSRMLDFLVPKFQSVAAEKIKDLQHALKQGSAARDSGLAAMAARIGNLSPRELVVYLRKRFSFYLGVAEKYNELSKTGPETPPEQKEEITVKSGLSPRLAMTVLTRLNRLCLILGLGKRFLEQHESALEKNLQRLASFFILCLNASDSQPGTLSDSDKKKIQDLIRKFQTLQAAIAGSSAPEDIETVLASMSDAYFREIQAVLAKPRPKVGQKDIKNDLRFLQTLGEKFLTPEKIFGSPGRMLLFLNSALESKEMERVVSGLIQPLHSALLSLTGTVKVQDLLRHPTRTMEILQDIQEPEAAQRLEDVKQSLKEIQDKSIREMLTLIRNTDFKTESEELERDFALLDRLLGFEKGVFGDLRLDAKTTVVLLLLNLDSFISEDLRALYKADAFGGKTSKQIIDAVLEKLKRRSSIIQAYNSLATLPPPDGR